jgi:nucleoside-triphosphatase
MFRDFTSRFVKRIWDQVDTVFALLVAGVCSVFGVVGVAPPYVLASATLITLTVLAFALIRDRLEREKTQSRLNQLLSQFNDPLPDTFFKYKTDEIPLLHEAEQEIWMVQETGNLISEKAHVQITSFLRRGGEAKIVVATPTRAVLHYLAFRNHRLTPDAIKARSDSFRYQIESILRSMGTDAKRLQIRFTPYPLEVTSVFVDPQSEIEKKRKAVIRYAGFRLAYDEKLDFSIQGDASPRIFSHYFREAQQFFEHASKIVLLTGEPGVGKTTLITKLLEDVNSEDQASIFSVISREILNGSERTGFEVITSGGSNPRDFATRRDDGVYDVDMKVWDTIAVELKKAHEEGKIIILDEIGPMQLQSQAFVDALEKIVNDPIATMFATIALEDGKSIHLRRLKLHYRSTVLLLTSNEHVRARIEKNLEREMKSSLYIATRIPHALCDPL